MTNTKLIGFSKEKAEELMPRIAKAIEDKSIEVDNPDLLAQAVITYIESTCLAAADITKVMPYLCICNTKSENSEVESRWLEEAFKQFKCDIEHEDIKEYIEYSPESAPE